MGWWLDVWPVLRPAGLVQPRLDQLCLAGDTLSMSFGCLTVTGKEVFLFNNRVTRYLTIPVLFTILVFVASPPLAYAQSVAMESAGVDIVVRVLRIPLVRLPSLSSSLALLCHLPLSYLVSCENQVII